jgi:predicted CopG family antitoxin
MLYKRINIGLRYDVYTKLKENGRFGESFSDLVSRILKENEKNVRETESGEIKSYAQ